MTHEEYIRTYTQHVLAATRGRPLYASLMMAQAILESADHNGVPGNSVLAWAGKNHFGIKADPGWKGEILTLPTYEVIGGEQQKTEADFRVYARDRDSFDDRATLLLKNKRCHDAGVFSASCSDLQAVALQAASETGDPGYAGTLIALMKTYDLYKLDRFKVREYWGEIALIVGE